MAFEVCRAVGNDRISRRMRFIEGIGGKAFHLGKNRLCGFKGNPPPDTAVNQYPAVFIAKSVEKDIPLLFHLTFLFLGHSASD